MFGVRTLKRRWVLGVIFGCSLLYFLINIQKEYPTFNVQHSVLATEKPKPKIEPDAIEWNRREDQKSNTSEETCRNSIQGRQLVADERGFVCEREALLPSGCCGEPKSAQFSCNTCLKSGCCQAYEYCVACCLQPDKQSLLRKILGRAGDQFQNIFASVSDHFELCLAKCRTSSQSVQHENSYRDPKAKFCYGEEPADIQPAQLL